MNLNPYIYMHIYIYKLVIGAFVFLSARYTCPRCCIWWSESKTPTGTLRAALTLCTRQVVTRHSASDRGKRTLTFPSKELMASRGTARYLSVYIRTRAIYIRRYMILFDLHRYCCCSGARWEIEAPLRVIWPLCGSTLQKAPVNGMQLG